MTPDLPSQLLSKIWDLLNDNTDWQVQSSNQVRYDLVRGTAAADLPQKGETDYPRAVLRFTAGSNQMFTSDETFQTRSPEGPFQWTEKSQYVLQLDITSALMAITEIDTLCMEAINALRRGGAHLRLTFVNRWMITWQQDITDVDEDEGVQRWKSRIRITVDCETQGTDML